MREKRRDARFKCEFPGEVRVLATPDETPVPEETFRCTATNVSGGGTRVALVTHKFLPVDTVAEIRLNCGGLFKRFRFIGVARSVRRGVNARSAIIGFDISPSKTRTLTAWQKFLAKVFEG
ncbi:MAG TPA: hypothetical protein VIH35_03405 [Kiritimatiellia bacterium]|jgi:ribosomal protein S8E